MIEWISDPRPRWQATEKGWSILRLRCRTLVEADICLSVSLDAATAFMNYEGAKSVNEEEENLYRVKKGPCSREVREEFWSLGLGFVAFYEEVAGSYVAPTRARVLLPPDLYPAANPPIWVGRTMAVGGNVVPLLWSVAEALVV